MSYFGRRTTSDLHVCAGRARAPGSALPGHPPPIDVAGYAAAGRRRPSVATG